MAAFVPTKLNQAGLDGIKQSMQGVTLSNATPPKADPALVAQHQAAADAFKAANWYNGGTTAAPSTQAQNLAAVINQPGNTAINDPNKQAYLKTVLDQAAKDTAAQNPVVSSDTKVLAASTGGNGAGSANGGGNASSGNASLINSMYDNNYASQLQKLQEARQIQQQGLNQQETGVNQNALQNLNNNDAMAAQQLKQLQEVQANNGVKGGDSITATIGNQTAQQQGANSINQDRMNQLTDIQQKRSLINNNASANDLALMQQLQAARSGQLIDNNNTQDQRALQLAMLMGKTADGQQTLGGQQQALAQQQFGLQQQNQQFNQGQQNWQNKFNYGQSTGQFDNGQSTIQKQQMDQSAKQFAQTMGLNYDQLSVQQQNILGQLAISQQNANTNATQANNSYSLGLKNNEVALGNQKIAQQTADSESKLRDAQGNYYSDKGDNLTPGTDKAYQAAVTLAQKDPLFSTYDPAKQQSIISTHYENLKQKTPGSVSDTDIQQFLKK